MDSLNTEIHISYLHCIEWKSLCHACRASGTLCVEEPSLVITKSSYRWIVQIPTWNVENLFTSTLILPSNHHLHHLHTGAFKANIHPESFDRKLWDWLKVACQNFNFKDKRETFCIYLFGLHDENVPIIIFKKGEI